jgi:WD40 repeat protein
MASASSDRTIKIWNPNTALLLRTLTGHTKPITGCLSLHNGFLASYSDDLTIKIWNPLTGALVQLHFLLLLKYGNIASGSANRRINI